MKAKRQNELFDEAGVARSEGPRGTQTLKGPSVASRPFSPNDLLVGLGFGCYTSWVSMAFHSMGLFSGGGLQGERVLDTVYLVSILTIVVTFLASAAFHKRMGRLLARRNANVVLPTGVTIATLLMPLASMESTLGFAALVAAGIFSGMFSGLQLLLFGAAFPRLKTRNLVASVASGQIFSSLLFALSIVFPLFEATLFAASMPCAAALLLHFGMKDRTPEELNELVSLSSQVMPGKREQSAMNHIVTRVCACVLLIGFANEGARTLYMQIEASTKQIDAFALTQAVSACIVTAGVILIALAALATKAPRMPQVCYHVLGAGLTAGVLLLPAALIYPSLDIRIPLVINSAAYGCFSMFMWLVTASICRQYSSACVRSMSLIRGAWAAGPLTGMVVARTAMSMGGTSLEAVFPVMLLGVIAVFLAANVSFDGSVLLEALDLIPSDRRQRFQEKCRQVAEKFGLSEREAQVMTLFAKGRNLEYIKDELCLSKSTVSTHRQHIYQKLGVHSLQEMLDIIQESEPRG